MTTDYKASQFEFGRLASEEADFHTGPAVAEDRDSLCSVCGEPFDGEAAFEVCEVCAAYAESGERDYDWDEGDR